MANLVVKFLLINPNNLLGDDLKDESVVKYSAGSNSIKIISSDSWTDIENSTSREKRVGVSRATNNTFVEWTSHCTESRPHAVWNPVTQQRANTILYHYKSSTHILEKSIIRIHDRQTNLVLNQVIWFYLI